MNFTSMESFRAERGELPEGIVFGVAEARSEIVALRSVKQSGPFFGLFSNAERTQEKGEIELQVAHRKIDGRSILLFFYLPAFDEFVCVARITKNSQEIAKLS